MSKLLLYFKSEEPIRKHRYESLLFGFSFHKPHRMTLHVAIQIKTAPIHCCSSGCGSGSYARHSLVVKLSSLSLPALGYVILLFGYVQLEGAARIFADFVTSVFSSVLMVSVSRFQQRNKTQINTEAKRRFLCEMVTITNERGEINCYLGKKNKNNLPAASTFLLDYKCV